MSIRSTGVVARNRGAFYRQYLVEDIYSRKIVGWEVHEDESEVWLNLLEQSQPEKRQKSKAA